MSKLYFLIVLAIITVSLGCGIPENSHKFPAVGLLKPEENNKEVTAENSGRVIRQDTPPNLESQESKESKEQDKEAVQQAEEKSDKLNKKVSDEIKDEIVKISENHKHSVNIQPAGDTIKKVHGFIKTLGGI